VTERTAVAAAKVKSRLGPVWVLATERGLREIRLGSGARPSGRDLREAGLKLVRKPRWTEEARRLLERYFRGLPTTFNLPLDLAAGTPFERRVWDATRRVPHGGTSSYGAIAIRIGAPRAARAVGNALGRNPAPIVIPCHRVILGSTDLGGFTGGISWKRYLIELERGQLEMTLRPRRLLGIV
jgi:O-6-methylguanine DNA methyltransferase